MTLGRPTDNQHLRVAMTLWTCINTYTQESSITITLKSQTLLNRRLPFRRPLLNSRPTVLLWQKLENPYGLIWSLLIVVIVDMATTAIALSILLIPSTVYDVRGRYSRIYEWTARIYINIP